MESNVNDLSLQLSKLYSEDKIEDAIDLILGNWSRDLESFTSKSKSVQNALKEINKGNMLLPSLEAGHYEKTELSVQLLHIYTDAVAYAPNNSPELSRAYACRSTLLCETQLYEDSLKDIGRALAVICPNHLKAKLYARRAKNLSALNTERSAIEEAIAESRRWMIKTNVDIKLIEARLTDLRKPKSYPKPFEKPDNSLVMSDITDANETLIGASNAIALKYSEQFGRHIVATRDIKVGETLVNHRAYASIFPLNTRTHCWNCTRRLWSGVPCKRCTKVMFCDENCRDEAWNSFHDVECPITSYVLEGETENDYLTSLRLAIKALKEAGSIKLLKEKLKLLDSIQDPLKSGFTGDILDNTTYTGIYTLNSDFAFKTNIDLHAKRLTMCALMLFIWACTSDIFGKKMNRMDELVNNESVHFMGRFIIKNMKIIDHNAQHEMELRDHRREAGNLMMISCLTSYFNHDCDPNAFFARSGNILALNSSHIIKNGEQIFISYGFGYQIMPTLVRQELFREQYNFQCNCYFCQRSWAAIPPLPSVFTNRLTRSVKAQFLNIMESLKDKIKVKYGLLVNTHQLLKDTSFIPVYAEVINNLLKYASYPCHEVYAEKCLLKLLYETNSY